METRSRKGGASSARPRWGAFACLAASLMVLTAACASSPSMEPYDPPAATDPVRPAAGGLAPAAPGAFAAPPNVAKVAGDAEPAEAGVDGELGEHRDPVEPSATPEEEETVSERAAAARADTQTRAPLQPQTTARAPATDDDLDPRRSEGTSPQRDGVAPAQRVLSPQPRAPRVLPALEVQGLDIVATSGSLGRVADWQITLANGGVSAVIGSAPDSVLVPLTLLTLRSDDTGMRWITGDAEPTETEPASEAGAAPDPFVESFSRNEQVTKEGEVSGVDVAGNVVLKLTDEDNHRHRVETGPETFLREAGAMPAVGERVVVEGVRARDASGALIVARSLRRGTDTVELRDESGQAAWRVQGEAERDSILASEVRGLPLVAADGAVGRIADVALDLSMSRPREEAREGASEEPGETLSAVRPCSVLVERDGVWLRIPWGELVLADGVLNAPASLDELRRAWAIAAGGL